MAFTEAQLNAALDPVAGGRTCIVLRMIPGPIMTDVYAQGVIGPYAGRSMWVQISSALSAAQAVSAINSQIGVTASNPIYGRMQSALAAVAAGVGYARIGLLGDSTTAGTPKPGGGLLDRSTSPVTLLRDQLLATQGRPTITSSFIGDQRWGYTNSITPYSFDARLTAPDGLTTSWYATGASPTSVGGGFLKDNGNANRLGFLPEIATDTTDIYYAKGNGLGTFSVTRNGGTSSTIVTDGTESIGKSTYASPLNSADPIYATRTSGGCYVIGMDSYNSAIKSIRLFGMGWSGGRAADWADTTKGYAPLNGLVGLGLDLVVARFGTNDLSVPGNTSTQTDPAAYQASVNKILDALAAAGTNVILATHYPINTTVTPQSIQDTYAGYIRAIATARGLKLHDSYARLGTWTATNAAGKMNDDKHPNQAGYTEDMGVLASLILTLA